jgi:hypothetical protein
MRMVMTKDRLEAIRAYKQGKLCISWGPRGQGPGNYRSIAEKHGWPTPLFGFKKALIAKILGSDENFESVLNTPIDIYFAEDWEDK